MTTVTTKADCTVKCRSSKHTSELTSALCTGADPHSALLWCARHCFNPGRSKDTSGRSLVHVAAATGNVSLLQWLIDHKDGQINSKDVESGYSSLHRAMFHGQIKTVVKLIQCGANIALIDHDGLTVLDHAVLDRPLHVSYDIYAPLDAYVWGTNSNYNLGLQNNTTRVQPDVVESFRKENLNISKVCLQKFHTGFITKSGDVLTCGHGRGGRLGHGSETMQLAPKGVQLPSSCVDIALGVDHTLFLCTGGTVFSCGLNTFHQLGHHPPPPLLLAPVPISAKSSAPKYPAAVGVAAAKVHSVFWTDDSLYTWGLNAGQLGHLRGDKTIIQPKLVSSLTRDKICLVSVSDGATVALTAKGDVMALYEYNTKKLGQRQHNIVAMSVTGGQLDHCSGLSTDNIELKLVAGGGEPLKVLLLSKSGKLSIWIDNKDNSFIPCVFNVSKEIIVKDMILNKVGLAIVTDAGEAWSGTLQQQNNVNKSSRNGPKEVIKIKRLSNIHRGVSVSSDPKGRNFCVLQVCPNEALTEIPEVSPSTMEQDMKKLLEDVHQFDDVHDVICEVGDKSFPAHSFILASGSDSLAKQIKFLKEEQLDTEMEDNNDTNKVVLKIDNIHPEIFEQILKYIYHKNCIIFQEGECKLKLENLKTKAKNEGNDMLEVKGNPKNISAYSVYSDNNKNRKKNTKNKKEVEVDSNNSSNNPLVLMKEAAKQLGVIGILKVLECWKFSVAYLSIKSSLPRNNFNLKFGLSMKNHPELCDVTIICDGDHEIYAHKCILVARSEYFFSMFSSSWTESSSQLNLPLDAAIVQNVIEYLYTDDCSKVTKTEDLELVCNVLVVADQFLLTRLKQICECQLTRMLTLKNVAEMLQFSVYYMSEQLQQSTMQFICLNLPALLENKTLELLDDVSFEKLDQYYRQSNPVFRNRRLFPIFDGVSRDAIEDEYEADPVSFEELNAAEEMRKLSLKTRRRRTSSGEKIEKGRTRLTSSDTNTSGDSDHETDDDEKSIIDFDIDENDENQDNIEPEAEKETESEASKSFFSELLNKKPIEIDVNRNEKKKSGRISQKERKRLSRETVEQSPVKEESPTKSTWTGWGAGGANSQPPSSSSLLDIMKMESKSPSLQQEKQGKTTKPNQKTSWKKIDLSTGLEKTSMTSSPSPVKSNPWNMSLTQSPTEAPSLFSSPSPSKPGAALFEQIMEDDVKQVENLQKAQSKPLYVTQIEEQAIEELGKFYNIANCKDEIITITRMDRGAVAAPVWRKHKK